VHRGHPGPFDARHPHQQLLPALPAIEVFRIGPGEIGDKLFPLADQEEIGNRSHDGRIIESSHASHQDERIMVCPFTGQQRDTRPLEHLQDYRIVHLVSERKGDDPELVEWLL